MTHAPARATTAGRGPEASSARPTLKMQDSIPHRTWRRPDTWSDEALTIATIAGIALLAVHLGKALSFLDPYEVDYTIFVLSVQRWWHGLPMNILLEQPPIIDYNAPLFHLMVLPFAWLPLPVSYLAWTVAGAASAFWCLRIVSASDGSLSRRQNRVMLTLLICSAAVATTFRLGQWSWILAGILLSGWSADRAGRPWVAGAWLGLAISLKPFLLLAIPVFVLRSAWRLLTAVAISVVAALVVGVIVFGPSSLREWVSLLAVAPPPLHVKHFINASVIGVVARSGLPAMLGIGIAAAICLVTIAWAARAETDRSWLIWMTGTLLASPLGWIYYEPMLLGPLVALARRNQLPRWTWALWPALVFPPISQVFGQWTQWSALTIGSIYCWGLLALWIAALGPSPVRVASGVGLRQPTPASPPSGQ